MKSWTLPKVPDCNSCVCKVGGKGIAFMLSTSVWDTCHQKNNFFGGLTPEGFTKAKSKV